MNVITAGMSMRHKGAQGVFARLAAAIAWSNDWMCSRTILASLLAFSAAAACGRGQASRMIEYSELAAGTNIPADHTLSYGSGQLQFGELRLPAARGRVPVVVLIHGGCWREAYDLAHVRHAAAALTRAGAATWTIEYRRLGNPGGGWPGTFEDVARAVDHVRALAARFPELDTARVVLAGHSAGGQLALWAASRGSSARVGARDTASRAASGARTVPTAEAKTAAAPVDAALASEQISGLPLRVAGVVSLAGITDLAAYASAPGSCNSAVVPLLGGTPAERPERYRTVSPVELVPLGVPVRLVHGAADPIVPVAQSEAFVARTLAAGGMAELEVVSGAGHFDVIAPRSQAWTAVLRAVRALAGLR